MKLKKKPKLKKHEKIRILTLASTYGDLTASIEAYKKFIKIIKKS